jgi:FAD/FMN-containing dehydrogenase
MTLIEQLSGVVGAAQVVTGSDMNKWSTDWIGTYKSNPIAVVRPANTQEVSAIMALAHSTKTPVVPVSGNTGLAGGTYAEGALMLSLERLNRVRTIKPDAQVAIVEAGVILSAIHDAADEHDLIFPVTFGAKGSAQIGGILSTNAGGSNVVRYGNTREQCLGLEVVMADGQIMDLMSELHKDNSGLNLRDLVIGAEGTLGIITAAVLRLVPKPRAYATAMIAPANMSAALSVLNAVQSATGGTVEAFEFMPKAYIDMHMAKFPDARAPFETDHPITVMIEVAATAKRDATPDENGVVPIIEALETVLAEEFETGRLVDAVVAQNEAQRVEMWARREAAAEVVLHYDPIINNDIAVPLDQVASFLDRATGMVQAVDAGATDISISHLGDGNIHYTIYPSSRDPALKDKIVETVEDLTRQLGGSFSAEHGIGLSKLASMARRKDTVALATMRQIKTALDPHNILNPGKVIPPA